MDKFIQSEIEEARRVRTTGGTPHPRKANAMPKLPLDTQSIYYQSDCEEAERTLRWLNKYDMSREKKWIVKEKQIPCAWYAIGTLAPQNGIKCIRKHSFQSAVDGRWHALVIAGKGSGKYARRHIGAGSWNDRRLALCFAYRNAIRQLLPMQPDTTEKLAYRSSQADAIKYQA